MCGGRLLQKVFVLAVVILLMGSIKIFAEADMVSDKTIYVDDDNVDGPWDGTMEHPYQHIQDAIDNASEGDTIFVYNGVYYENLLVNVSINLVGENMNNTVIDGSRDGTVLSAVVPLSIHGFTIQNSGHSMDDYGVKINISSGSVNISDNDISDNNGLAGLGIFGGSHHVVSNNLITFSRNYGVVICSDDTTVSNNFISNNMFFGLTLLGSNGNQVHNNTITANYLSGIFTVFCDDCVISENNLSYNLPFGIFLGNALNAHNIVTRNNFMINSATFGVFLSVYYFTSEFKQILPFQIYHGERIEKLKEILDSSNYNIPKEPLPEDPISGCIWDANYWGTAVSGPKVIYGEICVPKFLVFPWLNFDWHPAKEPYGISCV